MYKPYDIHNLMQVHILICLKQLFYQINRKNRYLTYIMICTLNVHKIAQLLHQVKKSHIICRKKVDFMHILNNFLNSIRIWKFSLEIGSGLQFCGQC